MSKFDPNIVWREKDEGFLWRKLTCREMFKAFYHAPATKFWANVVRDDFFLFDYLFVFETFSQFKILNKVLDKL